MRKKRVKYDIKSSFKKIMRAEKDDDVIIANAKKLAQTIISCTRQQRTTGTLKSDAFCGMQPAQEGVSEFRVD